MGGYLVSRCISWGCRLHWAEMSQGPWLMLAVGWISVWPVEPKASILRSTWPVHVTWAF